jgi:hypothetical protein
MRNRSLLLSVVLPALMMAAATADPPSRPTVAKKPARPTKAEKKAAKRARTRGVGGTDAG